MHLADLRKFLKDNQCEGMIVPRANCFQGEDVAPFEERLAWLTGFTGSAGFAIVLLEKACLFVDGRYTLQAQKQVDLAVFETRGFTDASVDVYVNLKKVTDSIREYSGSTVRWHAGETFIEDLAYLEGSILLDPKQTPQKILETLGPGIKGGLIPPINGMEWQWLIFLHDSGGQYLEGTTDVTRTVAIGEPTEEQKDRYTRVLKGHIALASAVFPVGWVLTPLVDAQIKEKAEHSKQNYEEATRDFLAEKHPSLAFVEAEHIAQMWLVGGFASGMLGIGSGVVITPALMMVGVPPLIAVASQLNNSIGTNFIGFLGYWRKRDVDFGLAGYLFVGGIGGAFAELYLLDWLHQDGVAYKRMAIVYAVVLRVGVMTGMLTSTLGGGNSLFMMPIVGYLIGRTSPVVAGTTLLAGFAITVAVTLVHGLKSEPFDIFLVFILLFGSTIGSQIGVRSSYSLPRPYLGLLGGVMSLIMSLSNPKKLDALFMISATPPAGNRNCTKGVVREIAYLGDMSIYYVELESGKVIQSSLPNLLRLSERDVKWDDEVYLFWRAENGVVLAT
eukprot:gene11330-11417_t